MINSERISLPDQPDQKINVKKTFNIDSNLSIKGYKEKTQWVPEIDWNKILIVCPPLYLT